MFDFSDFPAKFISSASDDILGGKNRARMAFNAEIESHKTKFTDAQIS